MSCPRVQLITSCRSVALVVPVFACVIAVLLVSNGVAESDDAVVQLPVQVYSLRVVCEDAKLVRSHCAAAPFSTMSPSGESESSPLPVGWNDQNVEALVQ